MKEIWKDIEGYEGLYKVSSLGEVKTLKQWSGNKYINKWKPCDRLLKQITHYHGYKYVYLTKDKKRKKCYVHRLVAQAFINNLDDYKEINHKDGNKANNCVNNLEWCSRKYNVIHSYENKLLIPKKGKCHYLAKGVIQYDLNNKFIKEWECINDASKQLNIANISISRCCKGKQKTAGGYIWKYRIKEKMKK